MAGHFATDLCHGSMPIILAYMYQQGRLELDGGEVPVYQFRDGAKFYGISVGIKPVYNLVVKTTTGIRSLTVNNKTRKSALYDLNGRRIPNVPSKGIYIQNGKKMIRK